MKKIISCILAVLIMMGVLAGCGSQGADVAGPAAEGLKIVTTIFPEYDWVREVLGDEADKAELSLLMSSGVDLHSYQPTANDIIKISTCDMFVYVGGESSAWVDDALAEARNADMLVINLLDVLGDAVKTEEIVEGMEHEPEEEHDHEEAELDEHVWLSLRHAETICKHIADKLAEIDADNAAKYKANAEAYVAKLNALDGEYQAAADAAAVKTLVFADRFPLRYLADDYGLDYFAAFAGCSAETEASFETVVFLAEKLNELELQNVLVIESSDKSIAKTVINSTSAKNQQILVFDSIQSVTGEDISAGVSYLSIMEANLAVLKAALAI